MRVLHLIRRRKDAYAESAIQAQERDGMRTFAVYMQDAVYGPFSERVLSAQNGVVLKEDCQIRKAEDSQLPAIDYSELAKLIFEYDRVVTW